MLRPVKWAAVKCDIPNLIFSGILLREEDHMEKSLFTETPMANGEDSLPPKWRVVLLISLMLTLAGCAAGKSWKYMPVTKAQERTIYVVAHGWHTGIVISREDLGPEFAFVEDYINRGRYYEFGWGEADFYQADKLTASIYLKAIFWRNPSVMHVFSIPENPAKSFGDSDVIELKMSETGLQHLRDQLHASFKFGQRNRPYPLKAGPHGESRFFKAVDYYVITNTCNRWTAKMLESGGVPMDTVFTLRAASVIRQVKAAKREYLKLRSFSEASGAGHLDFYASGYTADIYR
jgi:uncharacterized protein (TIGR02117 family)